jgi:hypothetical protein
MGLNSTVAMVAELVAEQIPGEVTTKPNVWGGVDWCDPHRGSVRIAGDDTDVEVYLLDAHDCVTATAKFSNIPAPLVADLVVAGIAICSAPRRSG